jgi:hypothetical protein
MQLAELQQPGTANRWGATLCQTVKTAQQLPAVTQGIEFTSGCVQGRTAHETQQH